MTTKTKIIIGLAVLAAGAAAYYFFIYVPKTKKELAPQFLKSLGLDVTDSNLKKVIDTYTISEMKQKI